MKTNINPLIEIAAQWWTDQLNSNSASHSGDAFSFMTDLLKETTRKELTEEDKLRFKENVIDTIAKAETRGHLILDCDTGPEYPLSEVARKSGLEFKNFPTKTTMWIDFEENKIRIRQGYQADTKILYPAPTTL